ncbi:hypothetical protein JKP88DRAFT_280902 [Tribonema minus]|uniref:Uncharacterized protein n=1 Tax=Tribonema minus TaxID=303371 RepID=A0A835YQJ2_9STRA|nr:hypothetical protein JKP88DRAFT_280902 [Tribonema minus]
MAIVSRHRDAGKDLNTNLRAAGFDIEPDLTPSQVQTHVDQIKQLPLIMSALACTTSSYAGISRSDGSDIETFSDSKFKEPFRFNRVNAELVEAAVHSALHHLPLGVRLHRARGRGGSKYNVVDGELLLAPFVQFLMVFKEEVSDTAAAAW